MNTAGKSRFLETLAERPIIGDGSAVHTLEKRGYIRAGPWTPECVVEYPDGVRQLHREFLNAGADVLQAFTYYASDDKLKSGKNTRNYTCKEINSNACKIVREVAESKPGTFICGSVSNTPSYKQNKGEAAVKKEFQTQVDVFANEELDFLLGEFFSHIEEACWAIEVMKLSGLPVGCTMCIGPTGDRGNVPLGECAVRMAKAGADLLGINCSFDPATCIESIREMKKALDAEGLHPFLMLQPLGYHMQDVKHTKGGFMATPEYPFAMEPRLLTRWDARKYAREAYEAGVRYIGGCCGFEPYHIRELAAELTPERGCSFPGVGKHSDFGEALNESTLLKDNRNGREYWENLKPSTGRTERGTNGTNGNNGTNGSNGSNGSNGTNGTNGHS